MHLLIVHNKMSLVCKIKIVQGQYNNLSIDSKYSLYNEELSTFGRDEIYNQKTLKDL